MGDPGIENVLFGSPRPHMLPPDTDLVGRDAALAKLHKFLAESKATAERHRRAARVGIYGEAGVGKSALGARFAYDIQDKYPDGALYVDLNDAPVLNGVFDVPQILRNFLLQLRGSPDRLPQDSRDLPNEFIDATDDKRLIVFLDNVKNYNSVKGLIPKSSTCLVIFTSNEMLEDSLPSLQLETLDDHHAVELFTMIARSQSVTGAEASEELVDVLKACAGLPIAIRVLAARFEDNPAYTLARIREDLERYQYQPHLAHVFGRRRRTIEACFRVSYEALNDVQAMLFRRLAVAPGESFDVSLGAYLGDLTLDGARLMLDELRALQVIRVTQDPDFFTMHSLWRGFAREQLDDAEAAEQLKRALTFYRKEAENADQVIRSLQPLHDARWPSGRSEQKLRHRDPALERDRALDWMEKQHRNLVAAVKRACDENQEDIAWRTCRALVEFFEIRGSWESWGQTHEAAAEVVPEQSLGIAHINYGLGRLNGSRRNWPEAIKRYRNAISLFRQHGEHVQVGRSLNALGDAYRYMRNWDAAENCFTRSLEILEEAHHPRHVAIAKRSTSTIHRQRGEFREAEELCRQALAILEGEQMRDERWIAATKLSLADIYLDSGSRDARGLLEQCLEVFQKLRDTHWTILTRRSLGEALREEEQYEAAMRQLDICLELLRETRDDHWEGQILHSMGLVYLDQLETARARDLFEDALKKFQSTRDTLWEGRTQVSIGRAAAAARRAEAAQAAYHAAWPLLVEQGAKADLDRLEALLASVPDDPGATGEPSADRA